jgi:hypothetical protein
MTSRSMSRDILSVQHCTSIIKHIFKFKSNSNSQSLKMILHTRLKWLIHSVISSRFAKRWEISFWIGILDYILRMFWVILCELVSRKLKYWPGGSSIPPSNPLFNWDPSLVRSPSIPLPNESQSCYSIIIQNCSELFWTSEWIFRCLLQQWACLCFLSDRDHDIVILFITRSAILFSFMDVRSIGW